MERQPPPRSPSKTMERQSLKEPFSLVHENSMKQSYTATGTEPVGTKFNPYDRHEPNRLASPELADKNNNLREHSSTAVSGRAKSNTRMRAPQTTRNIEHQRPRPISTGRIVSSEKALGREVQDAQAVTKAILDLRERREQSYSARRQLKQHPLHAHRSPSAHVQTQERPPLQDQKASFKLKEAENRIGTLLQELEELRFFHEIDMEPAEIAPTKIIAVPTKTIAGVPRSNESPGRRQQVLSPRRLASLDRTTLELEAQELQRQVEILLQEKSTLQSKVQLQEQQAKSHSDDANRIHKLESALGSIRTTLNDQIHEIQNGRALMKVEYESKLNAAKDKYDEAQQDAETLAEEVESQKEKLDRLELEFSQYTDQTKDQITQLQKKWNEKESELERQVAESIGQVESLHTLLDDREQDIVRLQKELTKSTLDVEKYRRDIAEQIEISEQRLSELRHEQDLKIQSFEASSDLATADSEEKSQRIVVLEDINARHAEKVNELERELAEVLEKHERSVESLKRTCDSREQRRLDDLVESQHSKNTEYEERIADIRKQLQLATDRHQTEIEQKEIVFKDRMEQAIHEAKHSSRSEYEPKVDALREELEVFRQKYDAVRQETVRYQVQSAGKDRDAAREWERRDALRQGEMERLNDKLDKAVRDLAEKESKVQSFTERLAESEQRCLLLMGDLEVQHTEEIKARDEILTQRKSVAKLKTELARKDFEIAEIREDMERSLEVLRGQLEMAKKDREQSILKDRTVDDDNKNRLANVTQTLEKVQKELITERARHESLESELQVEIAKFEGKLSATEATLKDKRLFIEDLEARLQNADELSSSAGGRLHSTIASLTREVESCKEALVQEQRIVEQKELEIDGLKQDLATAKKSNDFKIAELEDAVWATQNKLRGVEKEKADLESELMRSQEKHEIDNSRLRSLLTDKEEVSTDISRVRSEHQESINTYEAKVEGLQTLLNDKDLQLRVLNEEVESLTATIKTMSEEANTLRVSLSRIHDEQESNDCTKDEEIRKKEEEVLALRGEIKKVTMHLEQIVHESSSLSNNAEKWRQQIQELQAKLDEAKLSTNEIQSGCDENVAVLKQEIKENEIRINEMSQNITRIRHERAEAIDALEHMIEEVQLRQEEFDQLADILEKREEELDNAKHIATKALASAHEIKTRYKQRGYMESDKQTDLLLKIDGLNAEVDFLKGKTDELRKKSARMEAELREKNMLCIKLRDDLREQETKSTQSSSTPSTPDNDGFLPVDGDDNARGGKLNEFMSVREERGGSKDFMLMESGLAFQESDSIHASSISERNLSESTSPRAADLGDATTWLHDFEDGGKSVFSQSTPPERAVKNRSTERDKVRNFVRKRYLKKNVEDEKKVAL